MEDLRDKKLRKRIKELLFANINEGYSEVLKSHYCYIRPSPGTYSFQWFWDSCFHVFILCALGEYELAKRDITSLFAVQEENGFVGHVIFWRSNLTFTLLDIFQIKLNFKRLRPHMTAIIQPTFCAQAVERIFKDTNDLSFLKIMLPKLKKYHEWLEENRDFEKKGLISIITSYESGMDWKPSYDEVLNFKGKANYKLFLKLKLVDANNFFHGYNLPSIYKAQNFIVKDAGFNTIYALDLKAMSNLCLVSGEKEHAKKYLAKYKKTVFAIIEKMFDQGSLAFYDLYLDNQREIKSKIITPTIFFPLIFPEVPQDLAGKIIIKHLFNREEFNMPFPMPSVAKDESSFSPLETLFLWRGPTWVYHNWFLYKCLCFRGYKKEAQILAQTIKRLIEKSGFREYYNPFTGEGYGAKGFTWSGLVLDMR